MHAAQAIIFHDRKAAGQRLAEQLQGLGERDDVVVLALPRGGVPVAYEVARILHKPLDVLIVRKLGVPGQPELAMGAIASGNLLVRNEAVIDALQILPASFDSVTQREQQELARREHAYRGDRALPPIAGRTVILVDDGIATGTSMRSAVIALQSRQPAEIVVAVPTAARSSCRAFHVPAQGLRCVCLTTPEPFIAVGNSYEDFTQTSDIEVCALLQQAAAECRS
jgi:putative phosphoribosyl transferase